MDGTRPIGAGSSTHWPAEGRFKALWERFAPLFSDSEKCELLSLLRRWQEDNSTIVAVMDVATGEWVDVEPHWNVVAVWLGDERLR